MQENKTAELLEDMRIRMYERQVAQLARRVRWARYVLFFIAMIAIVLPVVAVAEYQWQGLAGYEPDICTAVFFFIAFFASAWRPYECLAVSAVAYLGLSIYVWYAAGTGKVHLYENNLVLNMLTGQIVIALIIRLILLFLLINGAVNARKMARAERLLNGA